jgi:hypothetical protein
VTPWANLEEALALEDVDDMSPQAIRAFLDIKEGGDREVKWYADSILTKYFSDFSPTAKSFRVNGGSSTTFNEYATFCVQWMRLQ